MLNYLLVALGGALGSIARFAVSGLVVSRFGDAFPLGTLAVNITGSFVIGFVASLPLAEKSWIASPSGRLFFMTGICGGYTTFSAFSLQTMLLARNEQWLYAGANAVLSLTLCLFAVWLGHLLAMPLNGSPR